MRTVVYITALTIILLIIAEAAAGYAYFQKNGKYHVALYEAAQYFSKKIARGRAEAHIEAVKRSLGGQELDWHEISGAMNEHLFTPEGRPLLNEFAQRYEAHFQDLKQISDKIGSKLIVIYMPSVAGKVSRKWSRRFYAELMKRHNVLFIDPTARFDRIGDELISLYPWNGHLSRYGHHLVAQELIPALDRFDDYQSPVEVKSDITHFTDTVPNMRMVEDVDPEHPYFVKTNAYGFRMEEDFSLDDPRQRIVIIGDSIAYGPYVANEDTFAAVLQRHYGDKKLFLNAASAGYSIMQEADMFKERTQYIAPDITILTVGDGDVYGLYYYKINEFDRYGKIHEPTELEAAQIKMVIDKLKKEKEEKTDG